MAKDYAERMKTTAKDFDKFIADYNHKTMGQIRKAKFAFSGYLLRKTMQESPSVRKGMLEFGEGPYRLQYIPTLNKDHDILMNVQIFRLNGDVAETGSAFEKLEQLFISDLSKQVDLIPETESKMLYFLGR